MKKHVIHMKYHLAFIGIVLTLFIVAFFVIFNTSQVSNIIPLTPLPTPTPTAAPTPSPTPAPKPLTFAEMNALYGPCAVVPTLFYHHIQKLDIAKQLGHAGLTVDTAMFQKQMQYLKDKNYTPIRVEQLIAFYDAATPLPSKPVLITFDDGYEDFGAVAAPILRAFGFAAVAFIPTGLIQNPGYMTWQTIQDITSWGLIYFANHTWSHKGISNSVAIDQAEIGTADSQLAARGLNQAKVFAYPYGNPSANGESVLSSLGYTLGFTTYPGFTQCKKHRFILPRTRIGNTNLDAYGL